MYSQYLQLKNNINNFEKRDNQHTLMKFMVQNYNMVSNISNILSKIFKIPEDSTETQDTTQNRI